MTAPYSAPLGQVTTALRDFFAALGHDVWDGAYGGDPLIPAYPYYVLYAVPGGSSDPIPTLDLDLRAKTAAWQLTAVSNLRNQAQDAAGRAYDLLVARTGDGWAHEPSWPDGWQCIRREPADELPGVIRTGEYPAAIYSQPVPFQLTLAPA